MKKKLLFLLFLLLCTLSFSACDKINNDEPQIDDNNSNDVPSNPNDDDKDENPDDNNNSNDIPSNPNDEDKDENPDDNNNSNDIPSNPNDGDNSKEENPDDTNFGNDDSDDFFHIYSWNEEFKGFFEKYVSDQKEAGLDSYTLDGIKVKWTINPNVDGIYRTKLDEALEKNTTAAAKDKVDLFLVEADYIMEYVNANVTQDITKIGVTDFTNIYNYTKEAASDSNGVVKGVCWQCCPSALIYNRVVAKALWNTDDPAVVGEKLNTWEKFDAVAAEAKAKGYYMTACEAETYRAFYDNMSTPWVDLNNNLSIPKEIEQWMLQAKTYVKNGYTIPADIWSYNKTANIVADANNTLCCFGPAWYYNFCMGESKSGDWGVVEGPMAHFWGGTWLLAPTGSDNTDLVAKVMNAFINDEEVCTNLIKNDGQFTNNQAVNAKVANDPAYEGNAFLGGQNDTKMFLELAKDIKFRNKTIYDQLCNEALQKYYREYLTGAVTQKEALSSFYSYISKKITNINIIR